MRTLWLSLLIPAGFAAMALHLGHLLAPPVHLRGHCLSGVQNAPTSDTDGQEVMLPSPLDQLRGLDTRQRQSNYARSRGVIHCQICLFKELTLDQLQKTTRLTQPIFE